MPSHNSDRDAVPDRQSDQALARGAQRGRRQDFGELVSRHSGRLLAFLRRRTRCEADAEDLLQESFARAFERLASYKPALSFKTWLYTIAWRLLVSHARKRRTDPLAHDASVPAVGEHDPAVLATQREQRENLWAAADEALLPNQYAALWLRYAEEMAVREVAKVMGKTQTHVKVLLFRARSRLAKRLPSAGSIPAASTSGAVMAVQRPCPTGKGGG